MSSGYKPVKKTYVCPFCNMTRRYENKTEIRYRGQWIYGCQRCYLNSIEDPKKFDKSGGDINAA